jgi:hypothetical protein
MWQGSQQQFKHFIVISLEGCIHTPRCKGLIVVTFCLTRVSLLGSLCINNTFLFV